jgi:hypothetical protein
MSSLGPCSCRGQRLLQKVIVDFQLEPMAVAGCYVFQFYGTALSLLSLFDVRVSSRGSLRRLRNYIMVCMSDVQGQHQGTNSEIGITNTNFPYFQYGLLLCIYEPCDMLLLSITVLFFPGNTVLITPLPLQYNRPLLLSCNIAL